MSKLTESETVAMTFIEVSDWSGCRDLFIYFIRISISDDIHLVDDLSNIRWSSLMSLCLSLDLIEGFIKVHFMNMCVWIWKHFKTKPNYIAISPMHPASLVHSPCHNSNSDDFILNTRSNTTRSTISPARTEYKDTWTLESSVLFNNG